MSFFTRGEGPMLTTYNSEAVTVADTAIGFTTATIAQARRAVVTIESAQVRYRCDGTAPTSTVGHVLNPGDELVLWGKDIHNAKFIRTGGVSASIYCSFAS